MAEFKYLVPINATPEKVYAALATTKGLQGWWTADSRADETAGGKAEFGFDRRGMVFRMKIEKLEPSKLVVWRCHGDQAEWNGTTLTWNIAREGDATVLRFTQSGWREITDFCAGCNAMWGHLMFRLKAFAETGKADPQWAT
jgi:uncharacterized protein YndB with AHSA1/START domain